MKFFFFFLRRSALGSLFCCCSFMKCLYYVFFFWFTFVFSSPWLEFLVQIEKRNRDEVAVVCVVELVTHACKRGWCDSKFSGLSATDWQWVESLVLEAPLWSFQLKTDVKIKTLCHLCNDNELWTQPKYLEESSTVRQVLFFWVQLVFFIFLATLQHWRLMKGYMISHQN